MAYLTGDDVKKVIDQTATDLQVMDRDKANLEYCLGVLVGRIFTLHDLMND